MGGRQCRAAGRRSRRASLKRQALIAVVNGLANLTVPFGQRRERPQARTPCTLAPHFGQPGIAVALARNSWHDWAIQNPRWERNMPTNITFPGVYVQELAAGIPAIMPAATSVAAFVGRAPIGPIDAPITIFNFGDFTRDYGGLQRDYPLSYAVKAFFDNGGSQAVIARLFEPGPDDGVARLDFTGPAPQLALRAANPGDWGNFLTARIDTDGITDASAQPFAAHDLTATDLFNLTLALHDAHARVVVQERFLQLSVKSGGNAAAAPNRIDRILAEQSRLARVDHLAPLPPLSGSSAQAAGGNDGNYLGTQSYLGDRDAPSGLYLLETAAFNLLCIPPDRRIRPDVPIGAQDLDPVVRLAAASYCADRRAIFIVDPPAAWAAAAKQGRLADIDPQQTGITGQNAAGVDVARNAAVYFPRLWQEDMLQCSQPALFAPCGAIAGVIAATDTSRGVWSAPAGLSAGLAGASGFEVDLTDADTGQLNPRGINCLRSFPNYGPVVWGARTLRGADQFQDEYKYLPVRRLALFIEQSVAQSITWAVFEPNAEPLWASLRLTIGNFLDGLQRQGAFYNYAVKCDATTTTRNDIDNGIVNIQIMFAPLKPAEFIVLQIHQMAGSTSG